MQSKNLDLLKETISKYRSVLIIQADNPDGDSLASALALESLLYGQNKETHLFCRVQIPKHLRHLPGWDRVDNTIPNNIDMAIIVDASQLSLLEALKNPVNLSRLKNKPVFILDHHDYTSDLPLNTTSIISPQAVATGEIIYELAEKFGWDEGEIGREMIAVSILYDSLGLSTETTTPRSIRIIANLVEKGVSLAKIDAERRETMKRSVEIMRYKAVLMNRIEFHIDSQIALVEIPWKEIEAFGEQYNPPMLVMDEMRLVSGVKIAVALKYYDNGKITGKIRSNFGYPISAKLAENFGGGGHSYAAGFKITDSSNKNIKQEVIDYTKQLLADQ